MSDLQTDIDRLAGICYDIGVYENKISELFLDLMYHQKQCSSYDFEAAWKINKKLSDINSTLAYTKKIGKEIIAANPDIVVIIKMIETFPHKYLHHLESEY